MSVNQRWLVLSDGARPTEDIYFLESAAPLLRYKGHDAGRLDARGWRWPLSRWLLSRQVGINLVLCRTLPMGALRWLERERGRFGRIVYLIDDDLAAAAEDETLPPAYRERMARASAQQPRLLALADDVVACSAALAARFADRHSRLQVMTPPLISPLPLLDHLNASPSPQHPWRIGFHGTRAHLADLEQIAPALECLQRERENTQLELMLGMHTPPRLAELPRVHCPAPLPWAKFRQYQVQQRVHIGLAPLLDTPFNRGKSFIKFLDITVMGGVGIYSNRYPYTEVVNHGENGLLAGDSPAEWQSVIDYLLNHPQKAHRMAKQAALDAKRIGNPEKAAMFWQERT